MTAFARVLLIVAVAHATALVAVAVPLAESGPVTIDGTIQSFFWAAPMEYKVEGFSSPGALCSEATGSIYYVRIKTDSLAPEKRRDLSFVVLWSVKLLHPFFEEELPDDEMLVMVTCDPNERLSSGKKILLKDYILRGDEYSVWEETTSIVIDGKELAVGALDRRHARKGDLLIRALDRVADESTGDDDELASMIQLWKLGKQWPAELAWWRSQDPNARKLAIALFYTSYPDTDMPQVPKFEEEADRFDKAESDKRKAELGEVLNDLPEIKSRLESLLKNE